MGEEAREAGDKARETEREIRVALGEARCFFYIYLSIYLSTYLSIFIYPFIHLSVYLSISIYLSDFSSICLYVRATPSARSASRSARLGPRLSLSHQPSARCEPCSHQKRPLDECALHIHTRKTGSLLQSSSFSLLSSLELNDPKVYAPQIRAFFATALRFCEVEARRAPVLLLPALSA